MKTSGKLALVILIAMSATVLVARSNAKDKEAELRTVRGTVVDKDENPVDSAVVYLKNQRTQDIVTHLSDNEGKFRFSGLDLNVDYEIHAVHGDMMSASRSISNFDTRKEFIVTLKLDRKKTDK